MSSATFSNRSPSPAQHAAKRPRRWPRRAGFWGRRRPCSCRSRSRRRPCSRRRCTSRRRRCSICRPPRARRCRRGWPRARSGGVFLQPRRVFVVVVRGELEDQKEQRERGDHHHPADEGLRAVVFEEVPPEHPDHDEHAEQLEVAVRVDPVLPVGDLDPVEHVRLSRLIGELHPAVVDLGVAALVFIVVEFVVKLVRPGPAGVLRRGGGSSGSARRTACSSVSCSPVTTGFFSSLIPDTSAFHSFRTSPRGTSPPRRSAARSGISERAGSGGAPA